MTLPTVPYGVTNLAGLIAWLRTLAVSIAAGWNVQHKPDGSHGTIHASGAIYERGRSVAMGQWTVVPFNTANFTSTGVGTAWGVDSGDVTTYAYTIVGNTMTVAFEISTTDVTGTPSSLNIVIPGGHTAKRTISMPITIADAGTAEAGRALVLAGGQQIACFRAPFAGNWTATSSDNTYVLGQITFEISE